ncbi:FAD-dependent monooxygenase [Streptomyces sp. NPDC086777]|uniref:FAD-dependent monooxygenase n=1 Tax=Streptomyces sp. NPDC086777 TaxID=3154866 RepID=UPI00344F0E12
MLLRHDHLGRGEARGQRIGAGLPQRLGQLLDPAGRVPGQPRGRLSVPTTIRRKATISGVSFRPVFGSRRASASSSASRGASRGGRPGVRPRTAVPTDHGHFSQYPRSTGGYFTILHPLEGDRYRLIFGRLSGDGPGREAPVTADEVREALHAVYGRVTELGELRAASRFGDAVRQVERYREGGFFAGDAAHIHMPIGGQGVNLGVQDAVNLGWKLAAEVRGWAPAELLDTYHDERHPAWARVREHTRAQAVLMNPGRDEEIEALRTLATELLGLPDTNRYISGMTSGLDVRYPGLGPRMPELELTTGAGPTRLSRLMHSGRGLLLSLDGRHRDVGDRSDRSDRVEHVVAECGEEVEGAEGAEALLVRPDGYIVWSTADGVPLETALTRWFG